MDSDFKIFAGNSNSDLSLEICNCLSMPLGKAFVGNFSDGEIRIEIGENVRGRDVFVIQSTCQPVNKNLMELLLMIDALKRACAPHYRGHAVLRLCPPGSQGGAPGAHQRQVGG